MNRYSWIRIVLKTVLMVTLLMILRFLGVPLEIRLPLVLGVVAFIALPWGKFF